MEEGCAAGDERLKNADLEYVRGQDEVRCPEAAEGWNSSAMPFRPSKSTQSPKKSADPYPNPSEFMKTLKFQISSDFTSDFTDSSLSM